MANQPTNPLIPTVTNHKHHFENRPLTSTSREALQAARGGGQTRNATDTRQFGGKLEGIPLPWRWWVEGGEVGQRRRD